MRSCLLAVSVLLSYAQSMAAAQDDVKAVESRWHKALNGDDPRAKAAAAKEIGSLAGTLRFMALELAVALKDPDHAVRVAAATGLRDIGELGQTAIPALIKATEDPEDDVRAAAASALGGMARFAKVAIPKLMQLLKDPSKEVRVGAIEALGSFGAEAKIAVPRLIEALRDKDEPDENKVSIPGSAASSLGGIGPAAKEAVPALTEAAKHGTRNLRGQAIWALGRIGPVDGTVVPTLIGILRDRSDPWMRGTAARALGQIGPPAKEAIPFLIEVLELAGDRDGNQGPNDIATIRASAADALGRMGEAARGDVVRALARVVKDERATHGVRSSAAYAIGALGPVGKDAVPALMEALKPQGRRPDIHQAAREGLEGVGSDAVPALIVGLKSGDYRLQMNCLEVICALGPRAREAAPTLKELAQDQDSRIYKDVCKALERTRDKE
jgi:HEAT repeat protein